MNVTELKPKSVISCPECRKRIVFIYSDALGISSIQCVKCKSTVLVDYDGLKAVVIPPVKTGRK
jgi:DNA-directed RNA polymerase subunit RPC12/RpoP